MPFRVVLLSLIVVSTHGFSARGCLGSERRQPILQKSTTSAPSSRPIRNEGSSLRVTLTSSDHHPSTTDASDVRKLESVGSPKPEYDSIVCGGGPAGLLSAIMLARKFGKDHKIAVCERRPGIPPSPADATIWSDVARFYLMGIGHRGQKALREFGIFEDFERYSVAVNGRRDWQPGKTGVEDGRITPSNKEVVSRILPRDKLVSVLHHHLVENYGDYNIDLLYGYEVDPISFGSDDGNVKVAISSSGGDGSVGPAGEAAFESTTELLLGADGSARAIANSMEEADAKRVAGINPIVRPFAPKPFKVTRYDDDNPRIFKSVPICLPKDWPCDLNYSARSRESRITLEALPSDDKGNYCALLLFKPEDELSEANVDPKKLRAFFDEEFPQFSALIDDDVMDQVATKPSSPLPAFRYVGPRLNMGKRTLVLGDAAHTVKPYFGLGANSAMEDVRMFSDALEESLDSGDVVPSAVELFSKRRSGDAAALVTMSRNMDRPGKMFYVSFLLPLILDGIFHKVAPKIFSPNMFGMFQKKGMGFKAIQTKKRLDRVLQLAIIGTGLAAFGAGVNYSIAGVARWSGRSRLAVGSGMAAVAFLASQLPKLTKGGRAASA